MSNENMTMRKAALAAMPSGPVPCVAPAGKKRVEIYDPLVDVLQHLQQKRSRQLHGVDRRWNFTWISPQLHSCARCARACALARRLAPAAAFAVHDPGHMMRSHVTCENFLPYTVFGG